MTTSTTRKLPLASLPLPPPHLILQNALTPDPMIASTAAFSKTLSTNPSIQRRARLLKSGHFSHVAPLPLPFPYRIPDIGERENAGEYIEQWLAEKEATTPATKVLEEGPLMKYTPKEGVREELKEVELLALAPTCLADCLPNLDVGNAFELFGAPRLTSAFEVSNNGTHKKEEVDVTQNGEKANGAAGSAAREELTAILAGQDVLMSIPEEGSEDNGYSPWSLRYSGHQFGVWAGQLGDGRAISILETPNEKDPGALWELQLKGAGRTPFSRSADGLAVLRSSVREFLGAEAMHALHIPTTRSLSLTHLPLLPVSRESTETAAILCRLAPSFLRVGSFEAMNPPQQVFLFGGGGQGKQDWEGLRVLGEWVRDRLGLKVGKGKWGKELVMEVARRNARMLAGWQGYGFMHGVMNTDNISLLGLTIDYGPYAFMDVYDSNHICNHTDQEGRYAFRLQPTMIIFAMRALREALAPLVGAEEELGGSVSEGWAADADEDQIDEWKKKGKEVLKDLEKEVMEVFTGDYWPLMRKRLGLKEQDSEDPDKIIRPLLDLMERHDLDFHITFRTLCAFRPSFLLDTAQLDGFLSRLTPSNMVSSEAKQKEAQDAWHGWLKTYVARLERETRECGDAEREKEMRLVNPRFVLRQWVLEDVIAKLQDDPTGARPLLMKVLQMATNPFDPWGAEDDRSSARAELDSEVKEEHRFCGIGTKKMLGFQCSCSS